jgi:hypothetical protein
MKKLLILFILAAISLQSQIPNGFSYQAVAFNSSGAPVTSTTIGLKIDILADSANGTLLYSEVHNPTTNTSGLYSLTIGKGTTSGNWNNINWSNGNKFIKIGMDVTGGTSYTTIGSNQLLSVPYSIVADSSLKCPKLDSVKYAKITDSLNKFCFYLKDFREGMADTAYHDTTTMIIQKPGVLFFVDNRGEINEDVYVELVSKNFSDIDIFVANSTRKFTSNGQILDTIIDGIFQKTQFGFQNRNKFELVIMGNAINPPKGIQGMKSYTLRFFTKTRTLRIITKSFYYKFY